MQIADKLSNNIDRVSDFISSKRELIVKQIINSFLVIALLLIFGCLDFANPSFHWENLAQSKFWVAVATKTVGATICAFNLGINFVWDSEVKKSTALKDALEMYYKLKDYIQLDFEEFVINIYNKEQKIKAYKSKINRKIYLLNKFFPKNFKIIYTGKQIKLKRFKSWLYSKYKARRDTLEMLKDNSYIEKNIDIIKVRYHEVDPNVFNLNINGSSLDTGVKVTGNVMLGRSKATINVILSGFILTCFFTGLVLEFDKEAFQDQANAFFNYCLHCAADVALVLWQLTRGMLSTRQIISSELIQPYEGRNFVLKKYINYRLEKKKVDDEVTKELNKINKVENKEEDKIIEITKDQYDSLTKGD